MEKKYQQSLRDKLKEIFREHPYFKLCKAVFRVFQEECPTMVLTPEELFEDTSLTLDQILIDGDISSEMCQELWTIKFTQYRARDEEVGGKENSTKAEVAALFYAVMYALQSVNHSHYRGTLQKTLHNSIFNLYYGKDIRRCLEVENKLRESVNQYTTMMMEWMEEYFVTEHSLTKTIEEVLHPQRNPNTKKPSKDNFKPIGTTFSKTSLMPDRMIDIIGMRLAKANKIANDNPDVFRKLFSGINEQFTIIWMGTGGELRDLFKMLTDNGYINPKRGYQKILQSHFLNENGERFDNLHGDKSIQGFQPVIDDCAFLLQYLTDSMTSVMKQLIEDNEEALREMGFFNNEQSSKQAGMRIQNKLR